MIEKGSRRRLCVADVKLVLRFFQAKGESSNGRLDSFNFLACVLPALQVFLARAPRSTLSRSGFCFSWAGQQKALRSLFRASAQVTFLPAPAHDTRTVPVPCSNSGENTPWILGNLCGASAFDMHPAAVSPVVSRSEVNIVPAGVHC